MPQMMPINWMSLFIMFIIIFLLFNIMNYFLYINKKYIKYENNFLKSKKINWKW